MDLFGSVFVGVAGKSQRRDLIDILNRHFNWSNLPQIRAIRVSPLLARLPAFVAVALHFDDDKGRSLASPHLSGTG